MTEVFSAKDYLSLLTCSTRRKIDVHFMLKELTNDFSEDESGLVYAELQEYSRTYQIGVFVSSALHFIKDIVSRLRPCEWDLTIYFDEMTITGCYDFLEDSDAYAKNMYYELGSECIEYCESTPLSFKFKKVDDNVKSRILGRLRQAEEFCLSIFNESLDIDESIEPLIDMDNIKIEDIEPPQGLMYALDIMAEKTGSGKNNNSEPATLESILPDVLKTDEAIKIFQNAIDAGLINIGTNKLEWTGNKLLLSYFAYKCSEKLSLGKKLYESGIETKWRPFETVFDMNNLRQSKSDYEKYGNTFDDNPPVSNGIIDSLLK